MCVKVRHHRITEMWLNKYIYPSLDECLETFNSPLDPKESKGSPILPLIDCENVKNTIDGM